MKLKRFIFIGAIISTISVSMAIVLGIANSVAENKNGTKISKFENLIDVTGVPNDYQDSKYESRIAPFSDLGSWHGHSLPGYQNRKYWGSFTQPLIVKKTAPRSISKSLDQLHLFQYELNKNGEPKTREDGSIIKKEVLFKSLPVNKVHIKQYPGGLWQEFEINKNVILQLDLRFTHQRTSTVKYKIINNSNYKKSYQLQWYGKLFDGAIKSMGAEFEDKATINSNPYKENINGQSVLIDPVRQSKHLIYYTNNNDVIELMDERESDRLFNKARQGFKNGKKYYLINPDLLNEKIQNKLNQKGFNYKFVNRYNPDDKLNILNKQNIIKNAVSIKFNSYKKRENWLGHKDDWRWQMVFLANINMNISKSKGSYTAELANPFIVEGNGFQETYVSTTFSFTSQEREGFKYEDHLDTKGDYIKGSYIEEVKKDMTETSANKVDKKIKEVFENSQKRWDYYIDNLIGDDSDNNIDFQKVAVKGMEVLVTNWRGASGMIEHQGITPSMSITWFNSFWSWDSWKQASASVNFDPKLAMDNIKVLYDYQVVNDPSEDFHYHFDQVRRKNDIGMIPDLIDYQQANTNWRDTKPPLSAWSVWNIYDTVKSRMWNKKDIRTGKELKTEVIDFLKYMYMRIMSYHAWWYKNRDGDGNGIVEYGATVDQSGTIPGWQQNSSEKEIVTASAWESGMDNAPRFDLNGSGANDDGLQFTANRNADGTISGWVLQQESVDLNSYMYAEKQYLIKIAKALKAEGVPYNELAGIENGKVKDFLVNPMKAGLRTKLKGKAKRIKIMNPDEIGISYDKDIIQMEKDAVYTKKYINDHMFDDNSGFYYDLKYTVDNKGERLIEKNHLLINRGKGPEGFIPLWAGVATPYKATKVKKIIMDPHGFNTFMPFPTTAWDNDKFEPEEYWRGPVWLDQAYFGVRALDSNGFKDSASYLVNKLFTNAEGLMEGAPIRENYNPITGKGLNAKGFSWSSGSYLLMYTNFIKGSK